MPTATRRPTTSAQAHLRNGEAPASRALDVLLVSDGAGGYQLATSGTPAAALLSDGAGGYVLTPGATKHDALVVQIGTSILVR